MVLMQWYILALIVALLSGINAIIHKKVLIKEHAMEFSTVFAILNVILSLIIIDKVKFSIPTNILFLIFFGAFLSTMAFLYGAKAVRHMEVSSAEPLTNISPALLAILSFFILKEAITIKQIFAIILIIIGAYVLEVDHKVSNLKEPFIKIAKSRYIHYIFLSIFLYAFTTIIDRYVLTHGINPFTYLFIVQIFIMVNFILLITVFHNGWNGIKNGLKKNWNWILLLSVLVLASRLSYFEAISLAYAPLVIAIIRLSTLFATVIGGSPFHEKGLLLKSIACIITLIGAALIIL